MWLQIFESLIRKESIIWPASRRLDSKEFSLFNHIESSGAKGPPPQMLIEFFNIRLDLHTHFSGGRSRGLVFPSLSEFSTVYCDPHTVKGFGIVNKAEIAVFLELSCFFKSSGC